MKLPLVAAFALVATAGFLRAEYHFKESIAETHAFDPRGEITLSNTNGAVVIRTWDRAEVKIEGEKRAKTDEELKLIGLHIETHAAELSVKTHLPKRRTGWFGGDTIRAEVRLTLTVPATVRLKLIEAVNGSVNIEGVRGAVTVRSVNGGVTAKGLEADTSLETVNGSIRAEFAALGRDQKISTRTVNGSSTVSLPRDASFALRANSVNGSVSCDFPIRLEGRTRRSSLSGTIGDGASSLKTETVNGSIRINQI